ncbi:conserved hypothetical protein [Hyella patelloides LEGE 07179]|uniref:Myosin heavy chain n=2 Tax=Hyella TaxID=945733 RepID=A0A563W1F9_9CYAN|nr:conserved hypothetical protein [Hyella patelloides LEGE 07179]
MVEPTFPEGKEQVMSAFGKLLTQYQKAESKVATKEEEAEKAKNQQLLTQATEYTVDNIVNGMASLQLDFGSAVDNIKEKLTGESTKLDELKKAISVEREHLQQLSQVRLVADALHILQQEHQEKLQRLAEDSSLQQEKITQEKTKTRKVWEQEQADYLIAITEEDELITQQREQEEADYQYELARQRKIETDEYEEDRRQQERELAAIGQEKDKDWTKREQYLADNKAEHTENKEKIAGFEEKIKTEYNKAKEKAIKEASAKAKVETDLLEKEWEAAQKGYDFQIESLEATIARQEKQIEELTTQLQESNSQAQNLALRAFNN